MYICAGDESNVGLRCSIHTCLIQRGAQHSLGYKPGDQLHGMIYMHACRYTNIYACIHVQIQIHARTYRSNHPTLCEYIST